MKNRFMSDEEYQRFFFRFGNLGEQIARHLLSHGLERARTIVDAPSGHGLFAHQVARLVPDAHIAGVGLGNDAATFKQTRSLPDYTSTLSRVDYLASDTTSLPIDDNSVDFVVNFLGMEDINMTRGPRGVSDTIREFRRVLRSGGRMELALCIEGSEPDEILNREVSKYVGHNAVFFDKGYYTKLARQNDMELIDEHWFYTCMKMTASQAEEELRFACEETPKIFDEFGVHTRSFEQVWDRFGERIREVGLAYYSDICVVIAAKR